MEALKSLVKSVCNFLQSQTKDNAIEILKCIKSVCNHVDFEKVIDLCEDEGVKDYFEVESDKQLFLIVTVSSFIQNVYIDGCYSDSVYFDLALIIMCLSDLTNIEIEILI